MLGENIQKINRMWSKRCVDFICQRGLFCVLQRYLKLVCESAWPGPFCLILTLYTSSGSSLTDLYGLFFRWNMCTSGDFTQLARKKIFLNQFSWQQCLNATLSHCEPLLLLRARCYLVVLPFFLSPVPACGCVISEVIVLFESTVLYLLSSRLAAAKLQAFGLQPCSDCQAWLSLALLSAVACNLGGCQWAEGLLAPLLSPYGALFSLQTVSCAVSWWTLWRQK